MKFSTMVSLMTVVVFSTVAYPEETKTLKGEVVDISCYVAKGAKGEGHKECAIACVKGGEPAGILEEKTDKVYVVVTGDHSNPADKVLPHIAKMVEVKGMVNERGGLSTIDIKEIKEIADQGATKKE